MPNISHYRAHTGSDPEKLFKATVFEAEGDGLFVGLNCLEPGQEQRVHTHAGDDKFYYVVEGQGEFVVGEETRLAGVGHVVCAPAGVSHGVANKGSVRLVVLVGMAPAPAPAHRSGPSQARKRLMPTKRVRKAVKRAKRKAKKTAKRARKAAGRAKKKASKTAKRARRAFGRAKKKATKTAKRAKKAAGRARKAVKRGTKKAKKAAKRAKAAAGRTKKKASRTARRAKAAVGRAKKKASRTAKRARKAMRRARRR